MVFSQNDEVVIGGVCYNSTSADDFCLAKINKTDGSIITYSNLSLTSSNDNAYSITKDNAGNFLISGQCNSDGSYKFCLTRILPNGTNMDTNFGTGTTSTFNGSGFSIFDITESIDDFGENIALQSNEKIIVGGSCNVSWEWKFCIARFHTNGTIDDSFGTNGYVIDSYGLNLSFTSIKIQHDDKILIGGTYNNAFYLLRMNADGKSLDESFGNNGRLFFDIPETTNEELFAIILQPDNAILVAGACSLSPSQEQLCIARFNSNGTIDTTFGEIDPMNSSIRKGYLVVNLNSSFRQIIKTIALQPDGKIVSAGTCIDTSNNHRYCVARFK